MADRITISVDPEQAIQFLEALVRDPDYLERFFSGGDATQAALDEYDITVPREAIPDEIERPEQGLIDDALGCIREGLAVEETAEGGVPFMTPFRRTEDAAVGIPFRRPPFMAVSVASQLVLGTLGQGETEGGPSQSA